MRYFRSTEQGHLHSVPLWMCVCRVCSEERQGAEGDYQSVLLREDWLTFIPKIWSPSPRVHAKVYSMLSIGTFVNSVTLIIKGLPGWISLENTISLTSPVSLQNVRLFSSKVKTHKSYSKEHFEICITQDFVICVLNASFLLLVWNVQ